MIDAILLRLNRPDPSNRLLLATVDVLYRIFGVKSVLSNNRNYGKIGPLYQLSGIPIKLESFQALVSRLVQLLPTKRGTSWKHVRNDMAFLLCIFSTHIRMAKNHLVDCGMMIASIINHGILGKQETDLDFQLDSSQEDMELLQYFIYLLKALVETEKAEKFVNEHHIGSVLLTLLLGPYKSTQVHATIGSDLEKLAWSTLHAIAKHCPVSLIHQHGANTLFSVLKSFGNTGNAHPHILCMSVQAIRTLLGGTGTKNFCTERISREVRTYFIDREGMTVFLNVLKQLMQLEELDANGKVTVSNVLFCCSILAKGDPHQRQVFCSLRGISTLTSIMVRVLYLEKSHLDTALLTAISECVCGCVAYAPDCLEEFLDKEGMFKFLDMLELSENPSTTSRLISCLLQLCDYPRCLSQLVYWSRSMKPMADRECQYKVAFGDAFGMADMKDPNDTPPHKTFASLICDMWKKEESRLKVLRDPDGCIASLTNPLMSLYSIKHRGSLKSGVVRSLLDVYEPSNVRHKLAVLIKFIVEFTQSEVTLFDGLSLINQIVLTTILNYDGLKISEICIEVIDEMHQQGFSDSADELSMLVTTARNRVSTIIELQRYLVRREKEKEASMEQEFYSLLKQCKLQDHLLATSEIDYLARTRNYQFLVQKRLWQRSELNNTAKNLHETFVKTSRIHRTSQGPLNITAWTIRSMKVDSEPPVHQQKDFPLDEFEDNDNPNGDSELDFNSERTHTTNATHHSLLAKHSNSLLTINSNTNTTSDVQNISPIDPIVGGFYQLGHYLLKVALDKVKSSSKNQEWINDCIKHDEENGWKVRMKWRKDWYP